MRPISLQDKLDIAIPNWNPTNCVGTTLFFAGEVEKDEHIELVHAIPFLEKLTELAAPDRGSIITWEEISDDKRVILHMGFITNVNPLLITHRPGMYGLGCNANVVEREALASVDKRYKTPTSINRYYQPRAEIIF